eukprot:459190-Prorocentrum_minimum.AAC.3
MVEGRRVGDPSRRVVELSGHSSDALHEDIWRVISSSIEKASGGVLLATDLTYLKEGMVRFTADPHLEVAQMEHVDFVHPLYILRGEKECPSS